MWMMYSWTEQRIVSAHLSERLNITNTYSYEYHFVIMEIIKVTKTQQKWNPIMDQEYHVKWNPK